MILVEKPCDEVRVLTYEEAINAEYCVLEVRWKYKNLISSDIHQFVHNPSEQHGWFSPSLNNCNQPYFERFVDEESYGKTMRCWNAIPSKLQRDSVPWEFNLQESEKEENG